MFKSLIIRSVLAITALFVVGLLLIRFNPWAVTARQEGPRGTGIAQLEPTVGTPGVEASPGQPAIHKPARVRPNGPLAGTTYKNVQVLTELPIGEFGRTMTAMTDWVAGKDSCNYCHVDGDFASDGKYTKVVARRMLQMVRHANNTWKPHVGETGITCYTCHRGNALPSQRWFTPEPDARAGAFTGRQAQNQPSMTVRLAALPNDPYTAFLKGPETVDEIRVAASSALSNGPRQSSLNAEKTYGLMLHLTQALGVNCTFCHNTRAFASWTESSPQRVTAWKGIRMVRDLNGQFLEPLRVAFPTDIQGRLGPTGDAAKLNCATCHQGVNKPLQGYQMAKHYPGLTAPYVVAAASAATAASAAEGPASAASSPASTASELELMAAATPAPAASSSTAVAAAVAAAPVKVPPAASAPAAVAVAAAPVSPTLPAPPTAPATPRVTAAATPLPEGPNCIDIGAAGSKSGVAVGRQAASRQVQGAGRLPFYSAPDKGCEMLGVFAQAGDTLEASVDHAGYTAVRYQRSGSGAEMRGWVRSERLAVVTAKAAEPARVAVAPAPAPLPAPVPGPAPVRLAQPAAAPARDPVPASPPAPVLAAVARPPAALATAGTDPCRTAEAAAEKGHQAPAGGPGRRVVTGTGRLQFYAAPDLGCRQNGIFILAGETVEVLEQFGEFATVHYVNPRNGNQARGWVTISRLSPGTQVVSQVGDRR